MKSLNLFLFAFSFLITSCITKAPRVVDPGSPPPQVAVTPPSPTQPTQPTQSVEPAAPVKGDTHHVGLVLGGAGVASFATIGIFKRFQEEGIIVDYIVTTGWPTLFALGYSYMKSVHDLEWFATRLKDKDFYQVGIFSPDSGYASHEKLSALMESSFKRYGLEEGKVPIIISATNTEPGSPADVEVFDKGDWRTPLLRTMSVPGIYRPYPSVDESKKTQEWITSLQGIDVEEGKKRGSETVVAIEMYEDYFQFLKSGKRDSSDQVFRKLYFNQLRKTMANEMKLATIPGKIAIGAPPTDLASKRVAIFAGYKEAARIARLIRK